MNPHLALGIGVTCCAHHCHSCSLERGPLLHHIHIQGSQTRVLVLKDSVLFSSRWCELHIPLARLAPGVTACPQLCCPGPYPGPFPVPGSQLLPGHELSSQSSAHSHFLLACSRLLHCWAGLLGGPWWTGVKGCHIKVHGNSLALLIALRAKRVGPKATLEQPELLVGFLWG